MIWRLRIRRLFHFSVFALLLFVFIAAQSTLWLQLFGTFMAPPFWLLIPTYWVLERSWRSSLLMTYFSAFALSSTTTMPLSHLVVSLVLLFLILQSFKLRVHLPGPLFFTVIAGFATFIYPLTRGLVTLIFQSPMNLDLPFFQWVVSTILNMILALMVHPFFNWLDQYSSREPETELRTVKL